MYVQGSLGSMLQGVSQQPARLRLPGQIGEQINCVSHLTQGLTTRPGSKLIQRWRGMHPDVRYQHVTFNGTTYLFGNRFGELFCFDLAGNQYTINYANADAAAYVPNTNGRPVTNLRLLVWNNSIIALNRDKTVLASSFTTGFDHHIVGVTALGGSYSKTYKVRIRVAGGTTYEGTYTTPDGTATGDGAKTTATYIIGQLKTSLDTAFSGVAGVTIQNYLDVLIVKMASAMTATVTDGEAGTILRVITDFADKRADLPRYAHHGTIVRVSGNAETDVDDYWLRYYIDSGVTLGDGFGRQGTWIEMYNPDQVNTLDNRTLPHVFTLSGSTFTLSQGAWKGREVGDDTTNPFPSFVGKRIRDLANHDGRLVVAAGNSVCMSRTNEPLTFFRKSATVLLDDDPIDLTTNETDTTNLDWVVPFDRGLIICSDPGKSQYIIAGSGLTPENASMVLTTRYEMTCQVKPVNNGRALMFPFTTGYFSGVKEFYTDGDGTVNKADTVTHAQNEYIKNKVRHIAVSENLHIATFLTAGDIIWPGNLSGTEPEKEYFNPFVYIYQFLWDGDDKIQSAWHKWEFSAPVRYCLWQDSKFYFICGFDTGRHSLEVIDLAEVANPNIGYVPSLDSQIEMTVQGSGANVNVRHPLASGISIIRKDNGRLYAPVPPPVLESEPNWWYLHAVDFSVLPAGTSVIVGNRFTSVIQPTMPVLRDSNGLTISSSHITIARFLVHLEDSGVVVFDRISPYRATTSLGDAKHVNPQPVGAAHLKSRIVEVPWGERSDYSQLAIRTTDARPVSVLEVEWEGQVTGSKRRV